MFSTTMGQEEAERERIDTQKCGRCTQSWSAGVLKHSTSIHALAASSPWLQRRFPWARADSGFGIRGSESDQWRIAALLGMIWQECVHPNPYLGQNEWTQNEPTNTLCWIPASNLSLSNIHNMVHPCLLREREREKLRIWWFWLKKNLWIGDHDLWPLSIPSSDLSGSWKLGLTDSDVHSNTILTCCAFFVCSILKPTSTALVPSFHLSHKQLPQTPGLIHPSACGSIKQPWTPGWIHEEFQVDAWRRQVLESWSLGLVKRSKHWSGPEAAKASMTATLQTTPAWRNPKINSLSASS